MRAPLFGAAVLWVLGGCSGSTGPGKACNNDSDCGAGRVCFVDGCGGPGDELIIEVTPQSQAQVVQEFLIFPVQGEQNLVLQLPSTLSGQISVANDGGLATYNGTVTVSGVGHSVNIPGLERRFRSKVTPQKGVYVLPISTGRYSVSFSADDTPLPPMVQGLEVSSGAALTLNPVFPDPASLIHVVGHLLEGGAALGAEGLALQATLADDAGTVVSQSVVVPSDGGLFDLALSPGLDPKTPIVVTLLSSAEATTFVPQKSFLIDPVGQQLDLDLGLFGDAFGVQGRVLDAAGKPVPGASVHLEGTVEGGGTFRSEITKTGPDGKFAVKTLATAKGQLMTLWIVPDGDDHSGIAFVPLGVSPLSESLGDVVCPQRVRVTGTVLLPDSSSPALGVTVTAVPIDPVKGQPLPSQTHTQATDAHGTFTVYVDPAIYRFDLQAVATLPRTSIFQRAGGADADVAPVDLGSIVLAKGHKIEGTVTQALPPLVGPVGPIPVARATVRFFRRDRYGESSVVRPLAETYTDDVGAYSVMIPSE